jgi:hypothetical protein
VGFQLTLGPADEPFVLFEEDAQPGMIVLAEEARHHEGADHAIAEQSVG